MRLNEKMRYFSAAGGKITSESEAKLLVAYLNDIFAQNDETVIFEYDYDEHEETYDLMTRLHVNDDRLTLARIHTRAWIACLRAHELQ